MQNPYCKLSSVLDHSQGDQLLLEMTAIEGVNDKLDPERLDAVFRVDLPGVG